MRLLRCGREKFQYGLRTRGMTNCNLSAVTISAAAEQAKLDLTFDGNTNYSGNTLTSVNTGGPLSFRRACPRQALSSSTATR